MKKFLLIIAAFLIASNVKAQLPNPDFEYLNADGSVSNWGNIYLTPVTFDSLGNSYSDSILLDNYFYFPTYDSYTGSHALEIHNALDVTTGLGIAGAAGVDDDSVFMGFGLDQLVPIQYVPNELTFSAKYFPVGGDSAFAWLQLYDSTGVQIAEASVIIPDTVADYTFYSVPVVYSVVTQVSYLSLSFRAFYYNGTSDNQPHYGTRLLIDNVFGTDVTGINKNVSDDKTFIYPNPASNNVFIDYKNQLNASRIEIQNMNGEIVRSFKNTNSFNVSDLTNGVYFVRLIQRDGIVVRKLVVGQVK